MSSTALHAQRRTHVRWVPILALIAIGTTINYLDRTVLGIAAPYLTRDLSLTAAQLGLVFSAFSWSYALLQIPGGIFLDRFGTRLTYFISIFFWSFFTALMAGVQGLTPLILTRIGVGIFEAPCFPSQQPHAGHVVSATRARPRQRDLLVRAVRRPRLPERPAVLDHAAVRLAGTVLHRRRPRHGFGLLWWRLSANPSREPDRQRRGARLHRGGRRRRVHRCSAPLQAGGTSARCSATGKSSAPSIGQFGGNSTQVFFVTWFPTYLVTARGMDLHQGRVDDITALHWRVGRRARRRARFPTRCSRAPARPISPASCRSSAACCSRPRSSSPITCRPDQTCARDCWSCRLRSSARA